MAKLHDVYYVGNGFDRDRRLPKPNDDIAYAHNTCGEGEYLIPAGSTWLEVSRDEALSRAEPKPGRPLIGDERRERYQVRLEPSVADWLESLGDGNRSAGIDRAAIAAGYKR